MTRNKTRVIVIAATLFASIIMPLVIYIVYSLFEAEELKLKLMSYAIDLGVITYLGSTSVSLIYNYKLATYSKKSVTDYFIAITAGFIVIIFMYAYLPHIFKYYLG